MSKHLPTIKDIDTANPFESASMSDDIFRGATRTDPPGRMNTLPHKGKVLNKRVPHAVTCTS